jgi:hypothetical protein
MNLQLELDRLLKDEPIPVKQEEPPSALS